MCGPAAALALTLLAPDRPVPPGSAAAAPVHRRVDARRTATDACTHEHGRGHEHVDDRTGHVLQQKVLAKNDELAERNRQWLRERGMLAINLMSSPGAGKTTLLERTARDWPAGCRSRSSRATRRRRWTPSRIRPAGCRVVQINTGVGLPPGRGHGGRGRCTALDPPAGSVVVIENVGNLVCPALFDLGEAARVVLASVTEGADKPLKYPHMFSQADLVLLNKTDLLPYVDFDVRQYVADLRRLSAGARAAAAVGDHRRRHAGLVRLAARSLPPRDEAAASERLGRRWQAWRSRAPATAAWPRLIPPSLDGTRACVSTRKPACLQPAHDRVRAAAGSGTPRRTAPPCPARTAPAAPRRPPRSRPRPRGGTGRR